MSNLEKSRSLLKRKLLALNAHSLKENRKV